MTLTPQVKVFHFKFFLDIISTLLTKILHNYVLLFLIGIDQIQLLLFPIQALWGIFTPLTLLNLISLLALEGTNCLTNYLLHVKSHSGEGSHSTRGSHLFLTVEDCWSFLQSIHFKCLIIFKCSKMNEPHYNGLREAVGFLEHVLCCHLVYISRFVKKSRQFISFHDVDNITPSKKKWIFLIFQSLAFYLYDFSINHTFKL